MDLKVTLLIVCLSVLAITSTEGGIPRCCIKTNKQITKQSLKKVERWYMQLSNGACDISALRLYVKGRTEPICAPPELKSKLPVLQWRMKQDKLNADKMWKKRN